MKTQLIIFTLITFCITNILTTACDDVSMSTSDLCVANTTCEWKGECKETTTNTAGTNCVGQTTAAACNGKCVFTETDDTAHTGTCAAGTKLQDGTSACSTATTSATCNGGCTWSTEKCVVKATSPTNTTNTTNPTTTTPNSAFGLRSSILIALVLSLF